MILWPGNYYHIYQAAAPGELLLPDEEAYRRCLGLYAEALTPVVETFAYCLLPDHAHFLVRVKPLARLAEIGGMSVERRLAAWLAACATEFGRITPLPPPLCLTVPARRYLTHLVVYIHQNPERHGVVAHFRQWPHTSYLALLSEQPTRLARETVLDWFLGREWFDDAHWQPVDESRIGFLIRRAA